MTTSAVSVPFTYGALSSSSSTRTSSEACTLVMAVSVWTVQTTRILYFSLSSRSKGAVTTSSVVFPFTANGAGVSIDGSRQEMNERFFYISGIIAQKCNFLQILTWLHSIGDSIIKAGVESRELPELPEGPGETVLPHVGVGGVHVWEAKFLEICLSGALWHGGVDKLQGDVGCFLGVALWGLQWLSLQSAVLYGVQNRNLEGQLFPLPRTLTWGNPAS